MRTLLPLLLLSACQDQGFQYVKDYGGVYESTLYGRVCDADSGRWLEGAVVYTHIVNDADELLETRETYTDAEGQWRLEELRSGQTYTVYVQYGNEIVDMFDVVVSESAEIEVPSEACGAGLGRVAVVTGNYDDWESFLPDVGVTNYELVNGLTGDDLAQFLSDPENLADFGAIFFAGGHIEEDVIYDADGSDPDTIEAVKTAIKDYVTAGGFVYASDWSYDVIELCWPNQVDWLGDDEEPDAAQLGVPDTVRGSIVDTGMVDYAGGDTVDITFDLDTWPIAESVTDSVTVYEKASNITYRDGTEEFEIDRVPLFFSFQPEGAAGKVVFSSWRVATNADGRNQKALRYVLEGN